MTIINVTKSPPDSNQQNGEVPMRSSSPVGGDVPGAARVSKKSVSFVPTLPKLNEEEINSIEQECYAQAQLFLGSSFDLDKVRTILKSVWSGQQRKVDDIMNDLLNAYFDADMKDTNSTDTNALVPVQGCANRPCQTDDFDLPELSIASNDLIKSDHHYDKEKSDLDRAIENSLKIQNAPETMQPQPITEEMLRGDLSVGVENIGQTCWFSVIAQVLFHIPRYRKLIYSKTPPEWVEMSRNEIPENLTERDLLVRMRNMFAEMDAGNRKFVDPRPVLEVVEQIMLKRYPTLRKVIGIQQDATELMMHISDWLEKGLEYAHKETGVTNEPLEIETAFQPSSSETVAPDSVMMECSPAISMNEEPMAVDAKGDHVFAVPELPPKRRNSKQDGSAIALWEESPLKEMLHGTMVTRRPEESGDGSPASRFSTSQALMYLGVNHQDLHDSVENYLTSTSNVANTKCWFEVLPSVIFFGLTRYEYNRGISKIHSEFDVPAKLYMDRHLDRNTHLVNQLAYRRAQLREQLKQVNAKLRGMREFPLGHGNAPLRLILESAKQYMCDEVSRFNHDGADVLLPAPSRDVIPDDCRENFLQLIEKCKQDLDMQESTHLMKQAELLQEIAQLFEREDLHKEEYILHSIVIHEGEASLGHYYACVRGDPYSEGHDTWQKFNDRNVEVVSWDQIQAEARGKLRASTSAYCLIYVRATETSLLSDAHEPFPERLGRLPPDLTNSVTAHNEELLEEIRRHREMIEAARNPIILQKADHFVYDEQNIANVLSTPDHDELMVQRAMDIYRDANDMRSASAHGRKKEQSFENDMAQNLMLMAAVHLRHLIHRLDPRLKDYDSIDQGIAGLQYTPQQIRELYQKCILEWPTVGGDPASLHARDCRIDLLSFWRATGIGMPALLYRYIIVKCIAQHRIKYLAEEADKELIYVPYEIVAESPFSYYIIQYWRIHALYCMMKQLWGLTKHILQECSRGPKLDHNTVNDYVDCWMHTLKNGHQAYRLYQTIKEDLDKQALAINCYVDPNVCIMDLALVRGIIAYPFLKLSHFVVYILMKVRETPQDAENLLQSENVLNLICSTLNLISKWASENYGLAIVILNSVLETLTVVEDMLASVDAQHRASTAIINNLRHAALPHSRIDSVIPPCQVHVQSMEHEINEVFSLRMEVGIADEDDAICTVTRLMEEASAIVTRMFQ